MAILEQIELLCGINRSEKGFRRNQTSKGFERRFTNVYLRNRSTEAICQRNDNGTRQGIDREGMDIGPNE
ncbi:hypothetical protein DBV15_03980 [Temnothorax longispinosus]|uniref:Uncharacterized protein n=1 Tax=Temnothorax longispinosus TaxID=300112 RepID=A0A4S2LAR5_9HYME|nr:hypothetical protein DBV15_03980 [Temnothorax longispinosus]